MGVEGNVPAEAVIKAVTEAGYGAAPKTAEGPKTPAMREDALADRETPGLRKRLISSVQTPFSA